VQLAGITDARRRSHAEHRDRAEPPRVNRTAAMSNFFQWDPDRLALDVPDMDREHQVLIACMNTLHELHEASASPNTIRAAIEKLLAVTTRHFADEEAYMQRIGYAGLKVHQGVHRQLLERLAGYEEAYRRERVLTPEFFQFLKMWLSAHIRGIDMKYAEHAHQLRPTGS
jgi:hemerythrin